jgi:hypothetical protein
MSINKNSKLQDFTRGSDTLWHSIQMFSAGMRRLLITSTIAATLVFTLLVVIFTNSLQREVLFKHYSAALMAKLGTRYEVTLPLPDGPRKFKAADAAEITKPAASKFLFFLVIAVLGSMGTGVTLAVKLMAYQTKRGKEEAEDKFIRGQSIVKSDDLALATRDHSKLGFKIGGVPIPDALLARNLAFMGNPGTGKSRAIFNFLDSARPAMKAVVYDSTGDYIERYYDPLKGDVILNPFDVRCAPWTIFGDLYSELDYSTIAQYFVPEVKGDANPIFTNGARLMFEDVCKLVQLEPEFKKTMTEVVRIITIMDLESLAVFFRKHGLASAGAMNPNNIKTSEGIRFTLTAQPAIRFFKYFDTSEVNFSIRDFVKSDKNGWLFISNHPGLKVAISPFAAVWLEIAMLSAMEGRPVDYTRIIFALDELASLPVLKSLETGLTQARKYGVSILLGFQTQAHVDHIWGNELRRVLIASCQTKVIFRTEESDTAKELSETLGKKEVDEASAGAHFGIESAKDTSQINRKRTEINLVTASEIITLPDRTAYLKVAGNYPIAKISIPEVDKRKVAEAYELRDLPALVATVQEVIEPEAIPAPPPRDEQSPPAPRTIGLGIF